MMTCFTRSALASLGTHCRGSQPTLPGAFAKQWFMAALIAMASHAVTCAQPSGDFQFAGKAPFSSTVGTWYTPWWDPTSNQDALNWNIARWTPKWRDDNLTERTEQYSYSLFNPLSDDLLKHQASLMESVGIEFVIADFTNASAVYEPMGHLERFQALDKVSVAVGIGGALQGSPSLDSQATADYAEQVASDVFNRLVVRGNYFHFRDEPTGEEKPLLVTYAGYDVGVPSSVPLPNWDDPRFSVQRATGMVDPSNPNLHPVANGFDWDSWWGWHNTTPFLSDTAMTVSPGYDTTHIGGSHGAGVFKERGSNGTTYQQQWLAALKQDPRAIVVTSWNDYNEENHIEPSVPTDSVAHGELAWKDINGNPAPNLFIDITRAYTSLRDRILLEGYYYRDEHSPDIYKVVAGDLQYVSTLSAIEPGSPVIFLPNDWLTQLRLYQQIDGLAGDYNADGVVNAADYTVWKDTLGSTTSLVADGNRNGIVDQNDYFVWQTNYLTTAQSSVIVPEPGTLALALYLAASSAALIPR